jgi:DNA-binding CsgD family transcriptional regulator
MGARPPQAGTCLRRYEWRLPTASRHRSDTMSPKLRTQGIDQAQLPASHYPCAVAYLRIGLVAFNALAFAALFVLSIRSFHREPSLRVRRLWLLVALASGALIVGSVQRLALQAATMGWLPRVTQTDVVENWQIAQSLIVVAIAVGAFTTVKKLARSVAASEKIASSILGRVGQVDLENLDLTNREWEVLAAIGSGLLTDTELAEALHISTNTVQTHIKRLLRKTGLSRRQDLVAVAHLVDAPRS